MPITSSLTSLVSAKRPNYFFGRLLSVDDLQAEQDYHRHQRWLHNRLLHGSGVVTGLEVTTSGSGVQISTGCALDCLGREIIVPAPAELPLPTNSPYHLLCVQYAERGLNPLPELDDTLTGADAVKYALTEETYTLVWCGGLPPHSARACGWHACGTDHAVPLARLARDHGGWRLDSDFRHPALA